MLPNTHLNHLIPPQLPPMITTGDGPAGLTSPTGQQPGGSASSQVRQGSVLQQLPLQFQDCIDMHFSTHTPALCMLGGVWHSSCSVRSYNLAPTVVACFNHAAGHSCCRGLRSGLHRFSERTSCCGSSWIRQTGCWQHQTGQHWMQRWRQASRYYSCTGCLLHGVVHHTSPQPLCAPTSDTCGWCSASISSSWSQASST